MKALFLIFHDLDPANGISKKILAQVQAGLWMNKSLPTTESALRGKPGNAWNINRLPTMRSTNI